MTASVYRLTELDFGGNRGSILSLQMKFIDRNIKHKKELKNTSPNSPTPIHLIREEVNTMRKMSADEVVSNSKYSGKFLRRRLNHECVTCGNKLADDYTCVNCHDCLMERRKYDKKSYDAPVIDERPDVYPAPLMIDRDATDIEKKALTALFGEINVISNGAYICADGYTIRRYACQYFGYERDGEPWCKAINLKTGAVVMDRPVKVDIIKPVIRRGIRAFTEV